MKNLSKLNSKLEPRYTLLFNLIKFSRAIPRANISHTKPAASNIASLLNLDESTDAENRCREL